MALVHPIFSVLVSKPDLVMDHLAGYAALAQEEAGSVGGQLLRRTIAWAACGVSALLAVLFGGVAIMLGAVTDGFHWALVLVPGVFLVAAVVAYVYAARRMPGRAFAELRAQLDADAQALRTLGGRP